MDFALTIGKRAESMNNYSSIPQETETSTAIGNLESRLYTVGEASRILGLATTWIYERTRKDAIPYHKLGKYIRFTISDLTEILSTRARGPKNGSTVTLDGAS